MKKTLGLAVGALALAAASLAVTDSVSAETYTPWIGPISSHYFRDASVNANLWTGSRVATFSTQVGVIHNLHHTQMTTSCSGVNYYWQINQHVDPLQTYNKVRIEYYCPNQLLGVSGRLIDY